VGRATLASLVFLLLLTIASSVELAALVVPGSWWLGWVCGISLAIIFGLVLRWRMRNDIERVGRAVLSLPEFHAPETKASFAEWSAVFQAIESTSQRLQGR